MNEQMTRTSEKTGNRRGTLTIDDPLAKPSSRTQVYNTYFAAHVNKEH